MTKRWGYAAAALGLLLVGCDKPAPPESEFVRLCKFAVEQKTRSPSTIEYRNVTEMAEITPPRVRIEFDAANVYGTPVRGDATCQFESVGAGNMISALTINGQKSPEAEVIGINAAVTAKDADAALKRLRK